MADISVSERATYTNFDRERGLRLARLVAQAFGALLLGVAAIHAGLEIARVAPLNMALNAIWLACLALFATAIWLTRHNRLYLASSVILSSTTLAIAAIQVPHAQRAGLDSLTGTLLGAYIIVIALSGVMANATFMFATVVAMNLLGAFVCFATPHPPALFSQAFSVWLSSSLEEWLAALLTFGAQQLYVRALHELGDIRVAYERAQKLDELKDQFIRNVNHELRNPIMALYSSVDIIRLTGDQMPPEKRAELLDRAKHVGDRVLALLKSILDAPSVAPEALAVNLQPTPLLATIYAAAELLDPTEAQGSQRALTVRVPAEMRVHSDPVRLQQIFINLLSNAVKYSPSGASIEIEAALMQPAPPPSKRQRSVPSSQIKITVRDHGLGIPPDQIPLLFQRFVRLPRDLASAISGNGLGLHLCKVLVEAMGGNIWVESAGVPGEGATFHMVLNQAL